MRRGLLVLLLLAGCTGAGGTQPATGVCGVVDLPSGTAAERSALLDETARRLRTARGTTPRDREIGAAAVALVGTRVTEAIASLAPEAAGAPASTVFADALARLRAACRR